MGGLIDFLVPKERKFIHMLQTQTDTLLEGIKEFNFMVSNFNDLEMSQVKEKVTKIKGIESKGDKIMGEIIDGIQETFITPLDREDIYNLTRSMDDILDFIYESAAAVMMYDVQKMPDNVKEYAHILLKSIEIIQGSMQHLKDYEKTKEAATILHNLEVEADNLFYKSIEQIFKENDDVKELIKLKDMYTLLEKATDKCNRIGIIMGNIVVKNG